MRQAMLGLVLLVAVACGSAALEPLPLDIAVTATPTATVPGDSISFVITAQGGNLIGLEMDYGDASGDLYGTGGARTARVTFRHAFKVRGTYTVLATITDAVAGQKKASIDVRVN